ncbi:hypothetical protein DQ04_08151040, partial [Trypanosoma grayi]|uniref:hypothetical protein n=1 Tax=Trypanosoma grayi TaxID=71804 RepID=UPI0004F44916
MSARDNSGAPVAAEISSPPPVTQPQLSPTTATAACERAVESEADRGSSRRNNNSYDEVHDGMNTSPSSQIAELIRAHTQRQAELQAAGQQAWDDVRRHAQAACDA